MHIKKMFCLFLMFIGLQMLGVTQEQAKRASAGDIAYRLHHNTLMQDELHNLEQELYEADFMQAIAQEYKLLIGDRSKMPDYLAKYLPAPKPVRFKERFFRRYS